MMKQDGDVSRDERGQLMQDEDQEKIKVGSEVYNTYVRYFGGWCLVLFILILIVAMTGVKVVFDFFLAQWT